MARQNQPKAMLSVSSVYKNKTGENCVKAIFFAGVDQGMVTFSVGATPYGNPQPINATTKSAETEIVATGLASTFLVAAHLGDKRAEQWVSIPPKTENKPGIVIDAVFVPPSSYHVFLHTKAKVSEIILVSPSPSLSLKGKQNKKGTIGLGTFDVKSFQGERPVLTAQIKGGEQYRYHFFKPRN